MNIKSNLVFVYATYLCVILVLIAVKSSHQECGNALEQGTVMCDLGSVSEDFKDFDFKLCTHGVVGTYGLSCERDVCKYLNTSEIQKAINFALPNLPESLGIYFSVSKTVQNYVLDSKLRRSNTIDELITYMKEKQLTFVILNGVVNDKASLEVKNNYFVFLQELAEQLQNRGYYLGHVIKVAEGNELETNFNETAVSKLVDFFYFGPIQTTYKGYMEPCCPLTKTYFGKSKGTTKYWIEKVLKLIKPECLIVHLGPRLTTHRAIETAVQPGPGSESRMIRYNSLQMSVICYELYYREDLCQEFWDDVSSTPWALCGNDYSSYDNAQSIRLKVDLLQDYNITGVMVWNGDMGVDNHCNKGDRLAILKAVQGIRSEGPLLRESIKAD